MTQTTPDPWPLIDAAMLDRGYRAAERYAVLGDCPPDIFAAVSGAATDRHDATADDSPDPPPCPQLAADRVGQMLDTVHPSRRPAAVPVRMGHATPQVTVYRAE